MDQVNRVNNTNDLLTGFLGGSLIEYIQKYFRFILKPDVENTNANIKQQLKDSLGFLFFSMSISTLLIKGYIWIFESDKFVPIILDVINPFYSFLTMVYSIILYIIIFIGTLFILTRTTKKSFFIDLAIHIMKLYATIVPFFLLAIQLWFAGKLDSKLSHPYAAAILAFCLFTISSVLMVRKVGQYLTQTYNVEKPYIKAFASLVSVLIIGSQIPSLFTNEIINKRGFFELAKNVLNEKIYNQEITKEMAEKKLITFRRELNIH